MDARLRALIHAGLVTAAVLAQSSVALSSAEPSPLSKLPSAATTTSRLRAGSDRATSPHAPLVASEFDCSVRVAVSRPMTILAEFRYQGALQYHYTARVTRHTHTRLIGNYFHDTKMPAGPYPCRFTLGGHHLGASFRSGGLTGNLLGRRSAWPPTA